MDAADVAGQVHGQGLHIGWAWGEDERGRPYLDFLSEHRHITAASVPLIYQFGPWPLLIVMSVLFAVALVGGTIDRRRLVAAGSADAVHARHALAGRSSVVANTDQRLYRGGR